MAQISEVVDVVQDEGSSLQQTLVLGDQREKSLLFVTAHDRNLFRWEQGAGCSLCAC